MSKKQIALCAINDMAEEGLDINFILPELLEIIED